MEAFLSICFFGSPVVAFIWFIASIVKFVKCPKELTDERKKLGKTMIISGIVSFVLIAVIFALLWMISQIVINM